LRPRILKAGRWNCGLLVMGQNYRKGNRATNSIVRFSTPSSVEAVMVGVEGLINSQKL